MPAVVIDPQHTEIEMDNKLRVFIPKRMKVKLLTIQTCADFKTSRNFTTLIKR